MFKTKALSIITFLSLAQMTNAVMIVSNPTADAANLSQFGQIIKQAKDSYEQIKKTVEQAKAQLGEIKKVGSALNTVNNFLNNSAMVLPDFKGELDDLTANFTYVGTSFKKLGHTLSNYNKMEHIRWGKVQEKCSMFNWNEIGLNQVGDFLIDFGEESDDMKVLGEFLDIFTDNVTSGIKSVSKSLTGPALAEALCDEYLDKEQKTKIRRLLNKQADAINNNDFEKLNEIKEELLKTENKYSQRKKEELEAKILPLVNRSQQIMQKLGVLNRTYNKGRGKNFYCQEKEDECTPKALELDYVNQRFLEEIGSAKKEMAEADEEQRAKIYNGLKFNIEELSLMYLKQIAEHIAFLNDTVAIVSSLYAEQYKKDTNSQYVVQKTLSQSIKDEAQELGEEPKEDGAEELIPNLDKYGFPTLSIF